MSLVYDGGVRQGRISLNRWVELTSTSPAKIFGHVPAQGNHRAGLGCGHRGLQSREAARRYRSKTLHMKVDYNPYEGREVQGVSETVISRGKVDHRQRTVRRPRRAPGHFSSEARCA